MLPRLRLVAPRRERRPTLASLSTTQGEAAMEEALRLCRDAGEGEVGEEVDEVAMEEGGTGLDDCIKDEEVEEDKADDDASEKSSSDGTEKFEIVN